jgi:aminopeptidase N
MYYKGNNMLHTIRQIVDDDQTWKEILRGLQETFRHQTVDASQIERYIIEQSGKDLDDLFDQYLHYADIPMLQYYLKNNRVYYRWKADIPYFNMPLKVLLKENEYSFIYPVSNRWKSSRITLEQPEDFKADPNFYIRVQSVDPKN